MSDGEYEKFEITDYDLENEFNPTRGRKKQTKNQQIYGMYIFPFCTCVDSIRWLSQLKSVDDYLTFKPGFRFFVLYHIMR